jgi:hypothetical protein
MPRLMVPSSGGGTKLIRTLRADERFGEGDRDSCGVGEVVGEGVASGDSCAKAILANAEAIRIAVSRFVIILV